MKSVDFPCVSVTRGLLGCTPVLGWVKLGAVVSVKLGKHEPWPPVYMRTADPALRLSRAGLKPWENPKGEDLRFYKQKMLISMGKNTGQPPHFMGKSMVSG